MSVTTYPPAVAGITQASLWRLHTTLASTGAITANLEVDDTYSPGSIGSAMTEASGVFTFPSTGIWMIEFYAEFTHSAASTYARVAIYVTTDGGSNWNQADYGTGNIYGANARATGVSSKIFDVTNVTTHKVKFQTEAATAATDTVGDTNINRTYMKFIRLGDT